MDRDKIPPIVGAALLVAGIIVVFFVFTQALGMVTNLGDYFREQFPEEESEEEVVGPTAAFSWNTEELDVNFQDESEEGDSPIRHWDWSFGDGSTSNQQNPSHTYDSQGDYRITLRVEDQNGETDSINTNVYVDWGNYDNGFTEESFGDMNFEFSAGGILTPIAAALLVGILFIVMFLVGAAMIKAGWNLIKPGPSTLKLKLKPKKLEVENTQPDPAYAPQVAHSPKPAYSHPEPAYAPQPTPDAVIASMRALPANQRQTQPATHASYPQQSYNSYPQHSVGSNQATSQPDASNPPPLSPPTPPMPQPGFNEASDPGQAGDQSQTSLGAFPSAPKDTGPQEQPPPPPEEIPDKEAVTREVVQRPKTATQPQQRMQNTQRQAYNQSRARTHKNRQQSQRPQNRRGQKSKKKSKKGKGRGKSKSRKK